MDAVFRPPHRFINLAVGAAAGIRDGLRATQFYVRDLTNAEGPNSSAPRNVTILSCIVARLARSADGFMTWTADRLIKLLVPGWRQLPSPFAPGMVSEVASAIRANSLVHNPLFNAYFFRAAHHILARWATPPFLVLEHRIDAARRSLAEDNAPGRDNLDFLAGTLIALVEAGPIARIGKPQGGDMLFQGQEPNHTVFSVAVLALLFAGEGSPGVAMDEDEFFAVTAALVAPRLASLEKAIAAADRKRVARELADILSLY